MAILEKVLLIDDDETTLLLCEFIMERYDFAKEIIKCTNGQEGLDYFDNYLELKNRGIEETAPKLVFLDLNMPIMNGWDFLEDLYTNFPQVLPETRVVILSSTVDPQDFERSLKYDIVVDFVNKPLNQASLSHLRNNQKLKPIFS